MIAGIGTDLVKIERIEKSIRRESFFKRVYGKEEQALIAQRKMQPQTAAANFAAKEAFGKALGTGIMKEFELCEVQALRDENGAPYYVFSGAAKKLVQERKLIAHLSISHEGEYAAAFAVLETCSAQNQ